jgi:hypothetical protein
MSQQNRVGGHVAAIFRITPFHVGWRVQGEVSGRRSQETVVGARERAIEIARYHAKRNEPAQVIVHRADGTVDEDISTV